MKLLINSAISKIVPQLFFSKDDFAIEKQKLLKANLLWNIESEHE